MERFMYHDEESFERMLKDKADEYKMYPSQQSWENIQKRIQPKSRLLNFKSIGLSAALLLGFAISISDEQTTKTGKNVSFNSLIEEQPETPAQAERNTARIIPITTAIRSNKVAEEFPETITVDGIAATDNELTTGSNETSPVISLEEETPALTKATVSIDPASPEPSLNITAPVSEEKVMEPVLANPSAVTEASHLSDANLSEQLGLPVVTVPKLKKQVQFYITSAASYRVLYNDNKLTFGNLLQQDPEKVARHTPSLGVEFGSAVLIPLSKNINFRTGIQLNYTRYNVEVFRSNPQVATVIMNNNTAVIQRITSLSSQSNNGLLKSDEVANETYQLSLPVGFEFKLAGKRKLQWNLATNVQPTYLLSASGYLLTNNFEKYIKAPDLLSNLNLNTSLETFLRWNVKDIQLQAGPQLRYQIFSNSQEGYPIKEHLVDYGFRIGIVKTLK